MRNLSSALMLIFFVGINYIYGFKWISLILILIVLLCLETPAKENIDFLKSQIEKNKAEIEMIKWNTQVAMSATKLNIKNFERMQNGKSN
jgi:hypothetical protein